MGANFFSWCSASFCVDPVLDRYRAAAMVDHGDWDGVKSALPHQTIEPLQTAGIREIVTANVDRTTLPAGEEMQQRAVF